MGRNPSGPAFQPLHPKVARCVASAQARICGILPVNSLHSSSPLPLPDPGGNFPSFEGGWDVEFHRSVRFGVSDSKDRANLFDGLPGLVLHLRLGCAALFRPIKAWFIFLIFLCFGGHFFKCLLHLLEGCRRHNILGFFGQEHDFAHGVDHAGIERRMIHEPADAIDIAHMGCHLIKKANEACRVIIAVPGVLNAQLVGLQLKFTAYTEQFQIQHQAEAIKTVLQGIVGANPHHASGQNHRGHFRCLIENARVCGLFHQLMPCRATTCPISWPITPANSASSSAASSNPRSTKRYPPGSEKALISFEFSTVTCKGTWRSECAATVCATWST